MQDSGLRVWLDVSQMRQGGQLFEHIATGVYACDCHCTGVYACDCLWVCMHVITLPWVGTHVIATARVYTHVNTLP